ncbi:MAG: hypothetical protein ACR2PH_08760 [Desulfobulbia bacterium]
MYFNKDAFSRAEKTNISPINETCHILENIDLSASQDEIERQLYRQGREIRDKYFLSIWRTIVMSINNLFLRWHEAKVKEDNDCEHHDMLLKKMEESLPRHMKGWIRTGGWI